MPTEPYADAISLLLPGTSLTDESPRPKTVTATGNATVSGAGYFDFGGNGSLVVANDADFAFGTGDFTIEATITPDAIDWKRTVCAIKDQGQTGAAMLQLRIEDGALVVATRDAAGDFYASAATISGGVLSIGTRCEVALVRNGRALRLFLDGALVASGYSAHSLTSAESRPLLIGALDDSFAGDEQFDGRIEAIRIVKGVSVFPDTGAGSATGAYIIKGAVRSETNTPLNGSLVRAHRLDTGAVLGETTTSLLTSGDALGGMVALRLGFDNGVVDASQYAHAVTLQSGAVVAPGAGKFGGALDCTDPSNDARIEVAVSPNLKVTGAFCLEFFVKLTVDAPFIGILSGLRSPELDNANNSIQFKAGAGKFSCRIFTWQGFPSTPYTVGQWHHIALARNATNGAFFFMDGVPIASGTATDQMLGDPVWMFGAYPHPSWFGAGEGGRCLLDEIVLTVGHERYPAAGFFPPAAPSYGSTVDGGYEIFTDYADECYVVAAAPTGPTDPVRNHVIHRVIPG